jgi:tRNA (guanine-N7-)-methyltransferase
VDRLLPLIEFPDEPLAWGRVFAVSRPVQVEIGSGKGRFLIRAAEADPATNWVGLERRYSHLALAVERAYLRDITNIVFVRCDAMEVVRRLIPAGSVGAFHVYYPDPWWKKRHKKRRVFSDAVIGDMARALLPGGELRVATDVADYFEEILARIAESGLFAPAALPDEAWSPGGEPLTAYEAKWLARGRTPQRASFRRGLLPAPPAEPWPERRPRGTPLAESLHERVTRSRPVG